MLKYHFRISDGIKDKKRNAGNKAVADCRELLLNRGYIDLEIGLYGSILLLPFNIVKLLFLLTWYLFRIRSGSLIFVQYPLLGINRPFTYYARILKWKKCQLACIIHDLDSIRSVDSKSAIPEEIATLNVYDGVISHNPSMTAWLKENQYQGTIHEIGLFDYLSQRPADIPDTVEGVREPRTVFAGNLGRTNFLHLAGNIPGLKLDLYGPGYENLTNVDGMAWKGSFNTSEIVNALDGHFGLVWDGDSLDECRGIMGNYLHYNTPHKVSLYLVAGLPVVVPKSAAIAAFVEKNGIGISISSLNELPAMTGSIEPDAYSDMQRNVKDIGIRLYKGEYFMKVLTSLEEALKHRDEKPV